MNSCRRPPLTRLAWLSLVLFLAVLALGRSEGPARAGEAADWAESVKLPAGEQPTKLFNGRDLDGWEGQIDKFWSVDDGAIKAKNTRPNPVSTYLFTKKTYRDFRLLLEIKQTRGQGFSTMHSAVALLGQKFDNQGDPFSYKGPLVLLCDDWGVYEVNDRRRLDPPGRAGAWHHPTEKIGDWNQVEVLVLGDRIRYVANGQLVSDYKEKPGIFKASPLGLQLHQNNQQQEIRFRGLILAEKPQDQLLTVSEKK